MSYWGCFDLKGIVLIQTFLFYINRETFFATFTNLYRFSLLGTTSSYSGRLTVGRNFSLLGNFFLYAQGPVYPKITPAVKNVVRYGFIIM